MTIFFTPYLSFLSRLHLTLLLQLVQSLLSFPFPFLRYLLRFMFLELILPGVIKIFRKITKIDSTFQWYSCLSYWWHGWNCTAPAFCREAMTLKEMSTGSELCKDMGSVYSLLLFYCEARWLPSGKFLKWIEWKCYVYYEIGFPNRYNWEVRCLESSTWRKKYIHFVIK